MTFPSARWLRRTALATILAGSSLAAFAHGDVVPHGIDTKDLPQLGTTWLATNPYLADADTKDKALKIGASGFGQNCARCHGIDAISGGIAPDLRKLDNECATAKPAKREACTTEIDGYFLATIRAGRTRNGAVYMPPFEGILSQEAMWAIKTYLVSRREKPF
ncbi:cytochrome c-550 PedF [Aquabacterium sp.]|jgi:cytochrome c-550 PedF|uniref:cytochrome c-550 PedF n=1 Tax=Aquabacterium sp. TaxID=1872578 RepID=UPI0025C1C8F1|nr:cytochrome c-550 PedF [Aquabacterium sp.]